MAEKSQILIVEDDLDLAEMLDAYFRVQGYDVLTAAWGEEAVKLSREKTPDLVVLDIRLPDIDGYEVCRRLRSDRRTQNIPIIFLTEKRDRVDKLAGLELGVVDYITKPFDIQELRLRIRNALQRASIHAQLNPITNLPEGKLVEERLEKLLNPESGEWAALVVGIEGLDEFREMYGFVASDDVLRAVAMMMSKSLQEAGGADDFLGHLDMYIFVMLTTRDRVGVIRDRIVNRVRQSIEYFYPLRDREKARQAMRERRLRLQMGQLTAADGPFGGLEDLKGALLRSRLVR